MFVNKCGDIIIKQKFQNYEFGPVMNIYKIEQGEFLFKGVLKNKLQIYVQKICENEKGDLFIIGNASFTSLITYILFLLYFLFFNPSYIGLV